MKNKVLIAASSVILLLTICFFSFFILSPTRLFILPIEDVFRTFSVNANSGDSINIDKLNKTAFDIRLQNPSKTIVLADSSLELAIKSNYISGIGEAYRVKGIGYSYLNDNDQAVKNYIEALKYFQKNNNKKKQARVYNNFGNLFNKIDLNKALYYYKKAIIVSNNLKNNELIASLYFNIATVYIDKSDFNNSRIYLEKSNKIFTGLKDTTHMILYHQNSGVINQKINKLEKAKEDLFQAKTLAKKRNLFKILVGSNLTLTLIYIKEQNFAAAKQTIKEGIYYSELLKDSTNKYNFIYNLYEIEKAQNNTQKALKYLIQVHKYDSLLLSNNQNDNIGKSSSYYIQKQKIQENELTISKQKYKETIFWWILTIVFSLVMLSTFVGIITYSNLQRKRKKEEIETATRIILLEQKTLQAMVNPHFIFNILNTIQYFILHENKQEANRIIGIFSYLMRKHLEISLKSSITLFEEIEYLSLYLSLEKIRFANKMKYNISVEKNIDDEDLFLPPMLIQPFIENAIWHGIMPKVNGGKINIEITCKNNELQIKITDDGIGISNSMKNKSSGHISRGLELIRERVILINKQNDRKISIEQIQTGKSGTQVMIQIPV